MRSLLVLLLSVAAAAQAPVQFVADFPPAGSDIDGAWEFNGDVLYSLDDGRIFELTSTGLQLVATAYAPGGWVKADVANGVLYYADTNRHLRTYAAGVTTTLSPQPFLRVGDQFADADGTAYFMADDGVHGLELWRAEGAAGPLSMVADFAPGSADAILHDFATVGRRFFCLASDPATEVFEATSIGLVQRSNLSPGPIRAGVFVPLGEPGLVGSRIAGLGFVGWNTGTQWPSTFPTLGAWSLFNIPPGNGSPASIPLAVFCMPFIAQLRSVGHDICCAYAQNDFCFYPPISLGGIELFSYRHGYHEIAPFSGPSGIPFDSYPMAFVGVNGTTCYHAFDSTSGREIRTGNGAVLFESIAGPQHASFVGLTGLGGFLAFANDPYVPGNEIEPLLADPRTGVRSAIDINPGPGSSYPDDLVLASGWAYVTATDGVRSGIFRFFPGATAQEVGAPSGRAAIAPWLAAERPVRGSVAQVLGTHVSGFARVLLAGSRAPVPLVLPGPCYLHLDVRLPILTLEAASNAGDWSYALSVPNLATLDGAALTLQSIQLMPNGGLEGTEAIVLTVGPN